MKTSIIFTFLLGVLLFTSPSTYAQSEKPNIVIIWGDDIGWFNVGAYNMGMMGYETPNIDRLAKEGASLLTGTANKVVLLEGRHF